MVHVATILTDNLESPDAQQHRHFFWNSERGVALGVHMDDIDGAGSVSVRQEFVGVCRINHSNI